MIDKLLYRYFFGVERDLNKSLFSFYTGGDIFAKNIIYYLEYEW